MFHQELGAAADDPGLSAVAQQSCGQRSEIFGAIDLKHGSGFEKLVSDTFEILHVRAGDNGNATRSGLENIVSASRCKGASDENNVGQSEGSCKLAQCVEKNDAGKGEFRTWPFAQFGAADEMYVSPYEFLGDDVEATGLARRENEKQPRELGPQRFKSIENNIVFVDLVFVVSRFTGRNGTGGDPDAIGAEGGNRDRGRGGARVVFQVSLEVKPRWRNAEAVVALAIDNALGQDQIG